VFDADMSTQRQGTYELQKPPNQAMKLTGASRRQLIARAFGREWNGYDTATPDSVLSAGDR